MTIEIHNTLTRRVEPLMPIEPGHVRMYVCGMTVYDLCHLGHARTFIAFDLAVRWMRARGLRVTYVRNITDVEDKIIRRAAERGITPSELTEENIRSMHEDFAALGLLPPDLEPRATQYIPQMLDLLGLLESKGLAYQSEADGDVNYAVRKFPGYGKLSGKSLDDLRAGERVAVDASKRDPLDFVLWKHAKSGEPQWESRWGAGRPGWHIECSAMASETLGRTFDIHGGGPDLVFPHHENEIAQSEGAYEQPFARLWMHSGALRVGEEKMSKSLGNFLTIRAALAKYDAEVLRFFLVRSHYRSQIAFTESLIDDAQAGLTRLYTALRGLDVPDSRGRLERAACAALCRGDGRRPEHRAGGVGAVRTGRRGQPHASPSAAAAQLKALGGVLGLLQRVPDEFLQGSVGARVVVNLGDVSLRASGVVALSVDRIDALIAERAAAKKASELRRRRPHPRRVDGRRHRARRQRIRYDLAPAVDGIAVPSGVLVARQAHAGAPRCHDGAHHRRASARGARDARRSVHDAGALDRRAADLGESGGVGLGPFFNLLRRTDTEGGAAPSRHDAARVRAFGSQGRVHP